MKYIARQIHQFDAFKMTTENRENMANWPNWMIDATTLPPGSPSSIWRDGTHRFQAVWMLQQPGSDRAWPIFDNGWILQGRSIVQGASRQLFYYSDSDFLGMYEPVDEVSYGTY